MKTIFLLGVLALSKLSPDASAQTPSPTEPSTSSGAVLFQDNFADPASGWVARKTEYGEFAYLDGEFRILLNKADFNTYSILPERKFDNVSVEVDARLEAGPADGVFGIICRAEANAGTASKAYIFAIRSDGIYAILKRTSPTFWDAIAFGKKAGAIKPGKEANRLRADCSGSKLTFYVNGEKLLETTDADFKSGQLGMAVTTQPRSAAMDVRFDNFVVRAIAP
ncbi:MAG: serine protease Do [Verrucomicrobiota bacterium]|jgi:hypothetical protein